MEKFINKVAKKIFSSRNGDLEGVIIVLPGKRAGTFLKKALSELTNKPLWSPKIYSIESWVEEISGFAILDRTSLVFEMYSSYISVFPSNKFDTFEEFIKWAPAMLSDFNEIEAYIKNPETLFSYLHDTKKIEHWSLDNTKPSDAVLKYLKLWSLLNNLFKHFKSRLKKQSVAFQGMAYKKASENINVWIKENRLKKRSVFYVGFNAMNPCEEHIMKVLLSEGIAEVFWDADEYYVCDEKQEAGKYLRRYKKWKELKKIGFNWLSSELTNNKKIRSFGVSKGVAQAQLAGKLINDFTKENTELTDVALVLADENLLVPILDFLPDSVDKLNVTMGCSLRNTPLFSLFDSLFILHINALMFNRGDGVFYYADLFRVCEHPLFKNAKNEAELIKLKENLKRKNLSFPSKKVILSSCENTFSEWLSSIVDFDPKNPFQLIDNCLLIITLVKENLITKNDSLELEQLYAFTKLFHKIKSLQKKYGFIKELKTIHKLYQESVKIDYLSYYGEPLSGLQIMGMLETRSIDFKHIILLSVNEGILPSTKNEQSFVPFNIRKEFGLPTYMDKDAIYAYHFYRLIQRCSCVTFIYNTQTDKMGLGEKSRFLYQLENELIPNYPEKIFYERKIFTHPISPKIPENISISKNIDVIKRLHELVSKKGFSPSTLNLYKNCPLQFYYEKVLNVKEPEELEEIIEANTLGSIIHQTLEELFKNELNINLSSDMLKVMLDKVPKKTKEIFNKVYKQGQVDSGKNKLIYTAAEQFINSYISKELALIKSGKEIIIKGIEEVFKYNINIEGFDFPFFLTGNADRIDVLNGNLRIIDYKTGLVNPRELKSDDMKQIVRDPYYNKAFQVLFYAYLYHKKYPNNSSFKAGIISFRSLKNGFMPVIFNQKKNETFINSTVLNIFEKELIVLIKELFDNKKDFHHNNRVEPCRFCDPNSFL